MEGFLSFCFIFFNYANASGSSAHCISFIVVSRIDPWVACRQQLVENPHPTLT